MGLLGICVERYDDSAVVFVVERNDVPFLVRVRHRFICRKEGSSYGK